MTKDGVSAGAILGRLGVNVRRCLRGPDGRLLLVTEKVTNNIDVFSVQAMDLLPDRKSFRTRFLVSSMWFFLPMELL